MNQINPIYLRSFILNSINYNKIEIKLEIWQSNTGKISMESKHSSFIGQAELYIEALKKLKLQVGAVSFKLRNPLNAKKDAALLKRDS